MPVSQRNPPACGWDEGEEEQTWRIRSFQAWSSSCIPPCLSVFLCWCLTPSSPPSLTFPPSISISCSSSPNGVVRQYRWCFPDVLSSNAAHCLPGPTELPVCVVPHYSFLCSTQVLTMIITSAHFFFVFMPPRWRQLGGNNYVFGLSPPSIQPSVCPSHSCEHNISGTRANQILAKGHCDLVISHVSVHNSVIHTLPVTTFHTNV